MHTAEIRSAFRRAFLGFEKLETREVFSAATLAAGTLTVTGTQADDRIRVYTDGTTIYVLDGTLQIGAFASTAVTQIVVNAAGAYNTVIIDPNVTQPAAITGDNGTNKFVAGGGATTMTGGTGRNYLFGGAAGNSFNGGGGRSEFFNVYSTDMVFPGPDDLTLQALPPGFVAVVPEATLTSSEVNTLLQRAAAASAANNAIIVVTDRNGRILGVRVESGVDPAITSNVNNLVFAVDGAYSLALTGAYFANDQAPLTSRTVQYISQSTITQREVDSNPDVTDTNSTLYGPGLVAPVGIGGHFPPNIANTPQVDLAQIELTNRDRSISANGTLLPGRFNIDQTYVPAGQATLYAPDSYGYQSGLLPNAQSRGIATLPGGIPIYKNGQVVGGIGVFFPGKTGYASEENSSLSATYDPTKPDLSLEAEWMAFAAVGGTTSAIGSVPINPVGTIGGIALPAGFGDPAGRIDLVGIQLDVFGPGGSVKGGQTLLAEGNAVGRGDPNNGTNLQVASDGTTLRDGQPTPSGWLVTPHDGVGITAAQVDDVITQGLNQANITRAAIRLPAGSPAKYVFAVTDLAGNVVGLYREPDATMFSIDVAVAKARNVAYYDNPTELQASDQLPGVAAGTAFTARTFRFLAEPFYPEGINGAPPGYFSILNDNASGTNQSNGLTIGPAAPASAYQSAVGYAAFNPQTNFHDPYNPLNQNGVVFFPGSAALYGGTNHRTLLGGFGVSGDGVDQDDVATIAGESGYDAPLDLRADSVVFRGVRLPYQKTDRNPEG
ncbi:heme-binding protein [Frigoriglobus tundricola]|uniref:Uncharacterized protein n=1 Tax=Frigoriglobus tundricola TaxID=2774151 RepID=A0A6M5YG91_9BACT|nr:heme-binding protein [Frigoriglobus tundricola]QJW93047.1 hypothetical protein FTUN_0547 [Frigoriglobus tundricola]